MTLTRWIIWHALGFFFAVAKSREEASKAARLAGWQVERVEKWK